MRRDIEAFKDRTFDLCILGGGITGAGVALDAATRGWQVALIDKGDFASGTSTASTKLIHGGLRYLEYGQFSLVHEALRERGRLLRNAPHLVEPLGFVLPFYRGQRLRPWQWRVGLTLYDLLAGGENIERSRHLSRRTIQHWSPGLQSENLLGGALYYDALMDDARVCIAVLQTAARHGAVLANYVEAVGFERRNGRICAVEATDHVSGQSFTIHCRALLNASGAWADTICKLAGDTCTAFLEPTKGVHVIVRDLGQRRAFLLLHPRDGRVFFVIPWLGKTLIGTTDTPPDADPFTCNVEAREIDYLLEGYNRYFAPNLAASDVMGAFAGLRPLIRSKPNEPSARSREFRLHESPSGLVTALGGKFTTFRQMAETIVDFLSPRIGKRCRCRTRDLRLEGTPEKTWTSYYSRKVPELQREHPLSADSARHLLHRYGDRVDCVMDFISRTPHGFDRVHPDEPDLVGEQAYHRAEEMAIYPQDLYLRRTRIGMWRPELLQRQEFSRIG